MTTKRELKREALKEKLVAAATTRIADRGLAAIRARGVAADVGCAVGSIYTVFRDLDDLILHVNERTLVMLGKALGRAIGAPEPRGVLIALAQGYAEFAASNRNLWDALFDHRMADGGPPPDWLLRKHSVLLQQIVAPLARMQPMLAPDMLQLRARTYFAAIHGIVSISLQKRFLGLPEEALAAELEAFVRQVVAGSIAPDLHEDAGKGRSPSALDRPAGVGGSD